MVSSSVLAPLGALLIGANYAVAFESITIPSTVKADTEVVVKIRNDIADGSDSFDAGFTHFNLYLSTTPPGWGTGPVCLLANGTKIDTTSVKVKIPADVVPSDAELQITSMEWNEDPTKDGPSGFEYSNDFVLDGGRGEWSDAELSGTVLGNMDMTPCDAYACVRECSNKYPIENIEDLAPKEFVKVYKKQYNCVDACPGTTYPPWKSVANQLGISEDDDVDEDEDSESSTEPSKTATTKPTSSDSSKTTSATDASETDDAADETTSATDSASPSSETADSAAGHVVAQTSGLLLVGLAAAYGLF